MHLSVLHISFHFTVIFAPQTKRSSNANDKLMNSESAENITPNENAPTTSSPRIRDRYLNRLGVGAGDDNEDELPLLNDN